MAKATLSVLRKMGGMKLRVLGISLVISTAMALVITGYYSAEVFDYSVERYFEDNRMPDVFYDFAEPVNDTELRATLSSLPDVSIYDTRLVAGGMYTHDKEDFPVVLIGVDNPARKDISVLTLDRGNFFSDGKSAVAIGGMEAVGIDTGSTVSITVGGSYLNLTITGVASSPEYMFPSAYGDYSLPVGNSLVVLYMNKTVLQNAVGSGVNQAIVILSSNGKVEHITEALKDYNVLKITMKEDHPSAVFMHMGVVKMRNMMPVMALIFMLVGMISIFMTVYRLVRNDSRYIGVMMAMGYDRSAINRAYISMGLVLTAVGGLIGTVLGVLFTQGIVSASLTMYSNLKLYYPPAPGPFLIGWAFIFGVVMVSVYIPVAAITRQSVREALEYRPKTTVKALRVFSRKLDRTTLMGIRNTTRNPGRMLLTVFVVGMTIGIAGSWLVMTQSAMEYMFSTLDDERWDIRADFIRPVGVDSLNETTLGFDTGDAMVVPFTHMAGQIEHNGKVMGTMAIGCDDMTRIRNFHLREGKLDFTGAVVSYRLALDLNLHTGDSITFHGAGGDVSFKVSGITDDLVAGVIYTTRANLATLFPPENCTGVYIALGDGQDADAVVDALRDSPVVSKVTIHSALKGTLMDLLEESLSLLYSFFVITLVITFVVASSAVIISSMERDVEFATLDTLGVPRVKVIKAILAEMSILALGSVVFGVPMAYLFAWILAKVMSQVLFYFPIYFVMGASITIFLIGFIFVLASSIVPVRYALGLDTEKTLRERTAG